MERHNIFVVGPEATGPAFIGRRKEVEHLRNRILEAKQSTGYAVVGPYRIGKSSLVAHALPPDKIRKQGRLYVKIVMKDCSSAYHFWTSLLDQIGMELELYQRGNPDSPDLSDLAERLARVLDLEENANWYIRLHGILTRAMKQLKEYRIPLTLIIDEFDYATEIFKGNPSYFSLLRTFGTGADYLANTVLIARHRLYTIEERDPSTSNLAGAYEQVTLRDFDESDMEDYYGALADYNVFLDEPTRKSLFEYAGTYPYLLSMFGQGMADLGLMSRRIDQRALDKIYRECFPMIDSHYEHLKNSLEADGDLEKLVGVVIGPCLGVTFRDKQMLESLGYLKMDGEGRCYAISPDFSKYLHGVQVNYSAWDLLMETERKLKSIFCQVYPKLRDFTYEDVRNHPDFVSCIQKDYPRLKKMKPEIIIQNMKGLSNWTDHVTILDTLTLAFITEHIKKNWDIFRGQFGDSELSAWDEKLTLISEVRKPMAHAHANLVEQELPAIQIYCKQVLEL